jgi:hypothetical protein
MKKKHRKIGIILHLLWLALVAGTAIAGLFLQPGCSPGIIAVLGTPTGSETKIPAEYDITLQKGQKILVLVDVSSSLKAHPNLRFFLTDAINKALQQQLKIKPEFLFDYDRIADYRTETSDFTMLSPEQVGSALGADLVLYVVVGDYRVTQEGDSAYLAASLDAQASLIKVDTGQKLWPAVEPSRLIQVGCESERRGPDVVAIRLASAAARCITRYLYNCPKNTFKISDERTSMGW